MYIHIYISLTKLAKIYIGEMVLFSINGAVKIGLPYIFDTRLRQIYIFDTESRSVTQPGVQ